MKTHKKVGGRRIHRTPSVVSRSPMDQYYVLHRHPQLTGDPEHAVCTGEVKGECIALFHCIEHATEFCAWKNSGRMK